MRNLFNFFHRKGEPEERSGYMAEPEHPLDREIDALYGMLADILGSDKLVIKAGTMDAMRFMRSPLRGDRVLALERIILEHPTLESIPSDAEIPKHLLARNGNDAPMKPLLVMSIANLLFLSIRTPSPCAHTGAPARWPRRSRSSARRSPT